MSNVTSPASATTNDSKAARFLEQRALVLQTERYYGDAAMYWRTAAGLWSEAGRPNRADWALRNASRCDDESNPEVQALVRDGQLVLRPINELESAPED